jgi:hypothetical protein
LKAVVEFDVEVVVGVFVYDTPPTPLKRGVYATLKRGVYTALKRGVLHTEGVVIFVG